MPAKTSAKRNSKTTKNNKPTRNNKTTRAAKLSKHPVLNLAKYDLKYIVKGSGIFAILLIVCAIFFNLTCYSPQNIVTETGEFISTVTAPVIIQIIHTFLYNTIIGLIIGLLLNCTMRLWHRFNYSCYGDASYLTHTLPITKLQLWTAKFLVILGLATFVIVSIAIAFLILNLTRYGQELITIFGVGPGTDYPLYIFTVLAQIIFIMLCGVSGIIIGHRYIKHVGLKSVLCGFTLYVLGACFMLAAIAPTSSTTGILFSSGLVYTALIAGLYVLDYKLLHRGVNVE